MSAFEPPALLEADAPADPLELFTHWYAQAEMVQLPDPSAMTLATATPDGIPSARVVLLRGFDERGFAFFTNYLSRKGRELSQNPRAALVFHWATLLRQVRIEGTVAQVSPEESDVYFRSRPHGHQLGALVSSQSEVIADRHALEADLDQLARQHATGNVPRPKHWGGFRVRHQVVEFWQNRDNRLHDRLRYRLQSDHAWILERLAP